MTTMSLPSDITAEIIAKLTASYGRPVAPSATPTRSDTPVARVKAAQVKSEADYDGSEAAPVVPHLITTSPLPVKGTLSARDYMIAMRRARTRDDRIAAIAGYAGFDAYGEYAAQELRANMAATQELRGAPKSTVAVHSARPTLVGFVSGMPNERAKRLGDLQGRETLAAETMADYNRQAKEALEAGDEANAVMYHGMAQVEAERLEQIKRDLAALL